MSDQNESSEKSFEPTQKRLEDARKKGEIPKSTDLTAACAYLGFVLAVVVFGQAAIMDFADPMIRLFRDAHSLSLEPQGWSGQTLFMQLMEPMFSLFAMAFLAPAVLAICTLMAQRAITFAPSKLAPKLSRISPIQGAKNKFGANGLFEFAKSGLKLSLVSIGAFIFVTWNLNEILGASAQSDGQLAAELGSLIIEFTLFACIGMGAIGAVDLLWQIAEHRRKNMMTRKEIEDEAKESEGDPHFKQARRSRAQEIALNSMLADVPEADVVIVNPTHFSVALKWDRSAQSAPICVAKGLDQVAFRIREVASTASVPIYSDPPTARAVFASVEVGEQISSDHYRAVAAAIRYADRIRKNARKGTI